MSTPKETAAVEPPKGKRNSFSILFKQFLPLSLSDVAMALGDPMQTVALARLPHAQETLAGVGVTKAVGIFLESPIIMMLHASTALSKNPKSLRKLWIFMLVISGVLTAAFAVLSIPGIYQWLFTKVFGTSLEIAEFARATFLFMILWPAAIAWRRFFQGILIRKGRSKKVGHASVARLIYVALCLSIGVSLGVSGGVLAGLALVGGVITEALFVTFYGWKFKEEIFNSENSASLPDNLPITFVDVAKYYMPLAGTMLLVWGGRAMLVGVVARAHDGLIALAAWPAAWGFVLSVANATRMVQQVIISHEGDTSKRELMQFVFVIGAACSVLLAGIAFTPVGQEMISKLLGTKDELTANVLPVMQVAAIAPLLIAFQNALQGFHIRHNRNWFINVATVLGVGTTLILAFVLIRTGMAGATSAGIAMMCGFIVEVAALYLVERKRV